MADDKMDTHAHAQPPRRPRSSQTTVSMNWDDADALSPHPRMKFEVAECIETKTITTTTTTKRSYPPVFVREPRPLTTLDSKEYPLAQKPTPPELANFTFDVGQYGALSWPTDDEIEVEDVRLCCIHSRCPLCLPHPSPATLLRNLVTFELLD